MPKRNAGLILYRIRGGELQVFLVHPGGPFWANKDIGAWSIPKGEYADTEDPLDAARREFQEETGFNAEGLFLEIGRDQTELAARSSLGGGLRAIAIPLT